MVNERKTLDHAAFARSSGVDSETTRRLGQFGIASGIHFDRAGRRFCDCCTIDGLLDYKRIRQFNLDGKTYLLVCDKTHTRRNGVLHSSGFETEVFSAQVLETAQIFEINRAKLDRTDLIKGQRLLEGAERDTIIIALLNSKGELFHITKVEENTTLAEYVPRWRPIGIYLADEQKPGGRNLFHMQVC